jgi:hypothetical protein
MVKRVLSKKQLNALAKGRATRANNIRLRKKSSNKYGGGKEEEAKAEAALERELAVVAEKGAHVVNYIKHPEGAFGRRASGLRELAVALDKVIHLVKIIPVEP